MKIFTLVFSISVIATISAGTPRTAHATASEAPDCLSARHEADQALRKLESAEKEKQRIQSSLAEIAGSILNSLGNAERIKKLAAALESEAQAFEKQARTLVSLGESAKDSLLTKKQRAWVLQEAQESQLRADALRAMATRLLTPGTREPREAGTLFQYVDRLSQVNALSEAIDEAHFARTALYIDGACSVGKAWAEGGAPATGAAATTATSPRGAAVPASEQPTENSDSGPQRPDNSEAAGDGI